MSDSDGDVLTVADITVTSSFAALLHGSKSLAQVRASGIHLSITGRNHSLLQSGRSKTNIAVEDLRLHNVTVDLVPGTQGDPPRTFVLHEVRLQHLGEGKRTEFHVALHNPSPPGELRSDGAFGTVDPKDFGQTPLSGNFTFENADLTIRHGISGILNASGRFQGRVRDLECEGTADVPHFQVFGSSHSVHLATRFDGSVDATSGNALLRHVVSRFNRTTVSAAVQVTDTANRPDKTVIVDLTVDRGRVDDVLLLFTRHGAPAMEGPIDFRGRFTIPPGPPDFLTRLKADGNFEIPEGRFTSVKVQTPVDRLSASAAGESKVEQRTDPTTVPGSIRASLSDRGGVTALRNVLFEAPGIRVQMAGTFRLHDTGIDLNGVLQTTGKLSDVASGVKSIMLKVLSPLWPKQAAVQSIPLHIGGNAAQPTLRLKLKNSQRRGGQARP